MQFLKKTSLLIFVTLFTLVSFGQSKEISSDKSYRFVFYNVENFFDARVDTTSNYHEFEPEGVRHWNYNRYAAKRNKIYQVISALGGWHPVTLIAFAEIENRFVLEDLIESSPLKNENFVIIHNESEDERGIDVGLIYRKDDVELLHVESIPIVFESKPSDKTRDILYVKGLIGGDSIHIFINHWPSRYGGLLETTSLRTTAAATLKKVCDSVCQSEPNANILIMGDFNDERENESMLLLVNNSPCNLSNLLLNYSDKRVYGTLKYQENWNTFDQVIVSEKLLSGEGQLFIKSSAAKVFSSPFLLEEDKTYSGMKPFRTYSGYKYIGGFSDHLPVYVDIYDNNSK